MKSYTSLSFCKPEHVALLALSLITLIQFGGILIFVKGFLLTRLALPHTTQAAPSLAARYKRAIILIVDALRYDFLFQTENPSQPYHNVLSYPAELCRSQPENALMYKFIADPPTTTLQRIKALTVGTLPTFIDAGSNFDGQSIVEDNWLLQAHRAGKRIAFMGDDTWLSVFPLQGQPHDRPSPLDPSLTWQYDSFNVEDLDTVDQGVRTHLYPLLQNSSASWDILIAHCLGLDHVGHRMGSRHPEMARKLREADDMVRSIVDSLKEDDLLILMGDHGMDEQGNHGGDTKDEVSAGMWMYSKKPLTTAEPSQTLDFLQMDLRDELFMHETSLSRQTQQLSFTSTISLLLGLPIPFSNLGSIIPELFLTTVERQTGWKGVSKETDLALLSQAVSLNANQIKVFLETYASEDLAQLLPLLLSQYSAAENEADIKKKLLLYYRFMDSVQNACRSIWATFSALKMASGLFILFLSLLAILRMIRLTNFDGCLFRETPTRYLIGHAYLAYITGLLCGAPVSYALQAPLAQTCLAMGALCASAALLMPTSGKIAVQLNPKSSTSYSAVLIGAMTIAHAASYGSNSFVMWEDRISLYLLQIPLAFMLIRGLIAPQSRLRNRICLFSLLAMFCLRLLSMSTICREEQQPHCNATFHLPADRYSVFSISVLFASILCSLLLPTVITKYLDIASANQGIAPFFYAYAFRACLLFGSFYWTIDWLISVSFSSSTFQALTELLITLKNGIALSVYTAVVCLVVLIWHLVGAFNLGITKEVTPAGAGESSKTRVQLLGFANSLGSTYLIFFSSIFALFFLIAQPIGQIALTLAYIAFLSYLEAFDSTKDVALVIEQLEFPEKPMLVFQPPTFGQVSVIVLLGNVLFFATGHQASLSSIQWKVAFVGIKTVTYPFSPLLVLLNTLAPYLLSAAAIPLLVFWNTPPSIRSGKAVPLIRFLFRACLLFICYHTLLTLPTTFFASWHRRHLMVWKVFAPRFMLSAMVLLAVDFAVLTLSFMGGLVTLSKSSSTLGGYWS